MFKQNVTLNVYGVSYFDGVVTDYNTGEVKHFEPNAKVFYLEDVDKVNRKGLKMTDIKMPVSLFESLKHHDFPLEIDFQIAYESGKVVIKGLA